MESGWFALLGVLVGALPLLFNGWRERRAQERRHLRQLAVEMALGEFKSHMELCQNKDAGPIHPPSIYLATTLIALEELMDGNIKSKNMDTTFALISGRIKAAMNASNQYLGKSLRQP